MLTKRACEQLDRSRSRAGAGGASPELAVAKMHRLAPLAQQLRPAGSANEIATVHGRATLTVAAERPTVAYADGRAGPDGAASLYGVDEEIVFVVRLDGFSAPAGGRRMPPTVAWTLSNDGVEPITRGTALVDRDGRAPIKGSLAFPGVLQCVVSWEHGASELTAMAAATVEPTKIPAALPVPDDFDEFWAKQRAELSEVEPSTTLRPVPSPLEGVDCFDVRAECAGGAPVSGYLARPSGGSNLPGLVLVHGAGVRSADLTPASDHEFHRSGTHGVEPNHLSTTEWAAEGTLALNINAHGVENGREAAYYEALGASGRYAVQLGRESKETSAFRGMFLRLLRAVDVLTDQPEWDGKTVAVIGVSQGGLQALALAGLDERITFFSAGVAAGCDHAAAVATPPRVPGWPKLLAGLEGEEEDAAREASRFASAGTAS